jgi:hypothetical protein
MEPRRGKGKGIGSCAPPPLLACFATTHSTVLVILLREVMKRMKIFVSTYSTVLIMLLCENTAL